ncbi:MAG: DUF3179 domain-containing protein [Chlorobi bacterium]|nr:DUF3179 domain-containing protein [Chlorobiota bacterium]
MKNILGILVLCSFLFYGCSKDSNKNSDLPDGACLQSAIDDGFVFWSGSHKMLYGGENPDWHFDITKSSLRECQLRFGLGREAFDALIDPQYKTVQEEDFRYDESDRFIIVLSDAGPKVYSITLLTHHEVINEVIDGTPVMVVYCVLADLAAVYNRTYCDTVFTFALSGYTYSTPEVWDGVDAFVFWDRETESLWWPLYDEAVSGEMLGTNMEKYKGNLWWEITWDEILRDYSDALVMASGQSMDPPVNWPQYENVSCR